MDVVYALEDRIGGPSLFLAGPTPRSPDVPTWRPDALTILHCRGFAHRVYVPETRLWAMHEHYLAQVHWELAALNAATVIAFWMPRSLPDMPGFTSNVEYGMFVQSGKIVLGAPPEAEKMTYLQELARLYDVPTATTLRQTMELAMELLERRQ